MRNIQTIYKKILRLAKEIEGIKAMPAYCLFIMCLLQFSCAAPPQLEREVDFNFDWNSANFNKHQDFHSNTMERYKGRCLAIIQSTRDSGPIEITVNADGFESESIIIDCG